MLKLLFRNLLWLVAFTLVICVREGIVRAAPPSEMDQAREAFFDKDYDTAFPVLLALDATPEHEPAVHVYLGVIYRDRGEFDAAVNHFSQAVEMLPDQVGPRLELATTYAWSEQLDAALVVYEQTLERFPGDRPSRLGRARLLTWLGKSDQAKNEYASYLSRYPSDVEAMLGYAFLQRTRMNYSESARWYRRALDQDPTRDDARQGLDDVRQLDRCRAGLGSSWIQFEGAPAQLAYQGDLKCAFNPEWEARVSYESNALGSALLDRLGVAATANSHAVTGVLGHRFTSELSAEAGYRWLLLPQGQAHQLPLRLSAKLGERWVGLLGIRPGVGPTTGVDTLADVGVQWIINTKTWLMLQNFGYLAESAPAADMAVFSAYRQLMPWLGAKAGGGAGVNSGSIARVAFAELELSPGAKLDLRASYELLLGPVERQALNVGLGRTF